MDETRFSMANVKKAVRENVEGNFFVDDTCINCDACRKLAPSIFGDNFNHSYIKKQPVNEIEIFETKQAIISCPVGSIGTRERLNLTLAIDSFPKEIENNIYLNGYNHKSSFGADSYFIKTDHGNWMVDSPRYTKHIVEKIKSLGGIKYIFLTHRDDVADAAKYAKEFGATRIIHEDELTAQPDAEMVLTDNKDIFIDDFQIIHTPGHTKGHLVLVWKDKYLFSGDHFAWSDRRNDWSCFHDVCWYSWDEQIKSVERMKRLKHITNVFPGHGRMNTLSDGEFPMVIERVVNWMQS